MRVLDGVQRGLGPRSRTTALAVGTDDLEVEPPARLVPDQPDLTAVGGGTGFAFTLHAYRMYDSRRDWPAVGGLAESARMVRRLKSMPGRLLARAGSGPGRQPLPSVGLGSSGSPSCPGPARPRPARAQAARRRHTSSRPRRARRVDLVACRPCGRSRSSSPAASCRPSTKSASGSSISCWIARRSGRAPIAGS